MANSGDPSAIGGSNAFVNDGSFMEMFKRLQEQQKDKTNETTSSESKEDSSKSESCASEAAGGSGGTPESESHMNKDEKKATEKTAVTIDPPLVKASQVVEYLSYENSIQ